MAKSYVGYNHSDMETEYAAYYRNELKTIPTYVEEALQNPPLGWGTLPDVSDMVSLEKTGYMPIETGYSVASDGSIAVAVLTQMEGVSPQMWDWWFAWHGSEDLRYKLWHPLAHLSAHWQDGRKDSCYVGRVSLIKEYIGANVLEAAIQFVSPLSLGFSPIAVNETEKAVYICAKIGHPDLPIDYGYLVHQVRRTDGGAEMRSRFWLGGRYVSARKKGRVAAIATGFLQKIRSLPANFAQDLLRHCSEEMNHLAAILPNLFAQYNTPSATQQLVISGTMMQIGDKGFEQKKMSTLFNKIVPPQSPSSIVEPQTIEDIINIVRYAKKVGKRITISSGGHSFSANFMRDDAILILMKNFNQYEINKEQMTAKAGPGVGGSVLMKALYKEKLFFPAGHCKGVCIGGYLLQGGYGWNGRKLGIACQSIIGMDIVTADGEFVHANEQQNADLFWAARGTGPGFFGVVVAFYLKIYPLPPYRGIIAHNFGIEHLESVYRWAYEAGANIPKAIEFQMLMNKNMLNLLGPGIEVLAPIFADTEEEFEEAKAFMNNSPLRHKATIATPFFNPGIEVFYRSVMTHYPANYHWGVDNMWTHAPIEDLLPYIYEIAQSLPPAPAHFLWLNWHPDEIGADMAYSQEDKIYIALYGCWKNKKHTDLYANWAANMMKKMEHLSTGIQLADEGLHKRPAQFMSDDNLRKVQQIRAERDPSGLFFEWHSKPQMPSEEVI